MNIHENGSIFMQLFTAPLSTIINLENYINNLVEAHEHEKIRFNYEPLPLERNMLLKKRYDIHICIVLMICAATFLIIDYCYSIILSRIFTTMKKKILHTNFFIVFYYFFSFFYSSFMSVSQRHHLPKNQNKSFKYFIRKLNVF